MEEEYNSQEKKEIEENNIDIFIEKDEFKNLEVIIIIIIYLKNYLFFF